MSSLLTRREHAHECIFWAENTDVNLLPFEVGFEKVGDNWDIEDNKNPSTGVDMPGGGKRMFVDAMTPQETGFRDTVYVKVKGLASGMKCRLKAFDVDDPTFEPPGVHIIDSNDTNTVQKGNDNGERPSVGGDMTVVAGPNYEPPRFVSSQDVTVDCTVDAQGIARLDNGELPKLKMTHYAGDNVRVAAVILNSDGTAMSGQDLNSLQVDNSTQGGWLPPSNASVSGFNGALSPMLTVWRKLNIAVKSMGDPAPVKNNDFVQGVVNVVYYDSRLNQTSVQISKTLDIEDRYEGGWLTVAGGTYQVISNTSDTVHNVGNVVVSGSLDSSVNGSAFKLVDDDDQLLEESGYGKALLPYFDKASIVMQKVKEKYYSSYISVEPVDASHWNYDQFVDFKLNAHAADNIFNAAVGVYDKEWFWVHTVIFAYQPQQGVDRDPAGPTLYGGTAKAPFSNSIAGYSVIYTECLRDEFFPRGIGYWNTTRLNPVGNAKILAERRGQYEDGICAVVAHEIGHAASLDSGKSNHDEMGMMTSGNLSFLESFTPKSIVRFRNARRWGPTSILPSFDNEYTSLIFDLFKR